MDKTLTPLGKLIQEIDNEIIEAQKANDGAGMLTLKMCKRMATALLPEERASMEKMYEQGNEDGFNKESYPTTIFDTHFTQTP